MGWLDDLNDLAETAKSTDIKSGPHPFGEFNGTITEVKKGIKGDRNSPVWDLTIKTGKGTAFHTIWGFTEADVERAKVDDEVRQKIINGIARTKRLVTNCGLSEPKNWNDMLTSFGKLRGAKCRVVVLADNNNSKYRRTYINKYIEESRDISAPTSEKISEPKTTNLDDIPF